MHAVMSCVVHAASNLCCRPASPHHTGPSHASFGGGLFDFDPEDYAYAAPTRPPRPARPTRATFHRPGRPSHAQSGHAPAPAPGPGTSVVYRPRPTHYPPRPPEPPYPSHGGHNSHHTGHHRPPPDPPNKVETAARHLPVSFVATMFSLIYHNA